MPLVTEEIVARFPHIAAAVVVKADQQGEDVGNSAAVLAQAVGAKRAIGHIKTAYLHRQLEPPTQDTIITWINNGLTAAAATQTSKQAQENEAP